MRGECQDIARANVDALMAWWTLAGVDAAVGEGPVNWLRPVAATAPVTQEQGANPSPTAHPAALPDTLEAFHAWLADSPGLAEASWHGPRILPVGPVAARLMVILDVPDQADTHASGLLAKDSDTLLTAILRAIGVDRNEAYLCSLAVLRPFGGVMDAEMLGRLGERMRHHISLVSPAALLILGDGTSRALVPTNASGASRYIPDVNHAGGTIPGVATFHPRLMLHQPSAKAECWRTLQLMIKDRAP
ncbi:MAG: uracil-DNA glycosylase [Sphingobium sp.]